MNWLADGICKEMSGQSSLSFTRDVSRRRMDAHYYLPGSLFCLLQLPDSPQLVYLVAAGTAHWLPDTFSSVSPALAVWKAAEGLSFVV